MSEWVNWHPRLFGHSGKLLRTLGALCLILSFILRHCTVKASHTELTIFIIPWRWEFFPICFLSAVYPFSSMSVAIVTALRQSWANLTQAGWLLQWWQQASYIVEWVSQMSWLPLSSRPHGSLLHCRCWAFKAVHVQLSRKMNVASTKFLSAFVLILLGTIIIIILDLFLSAAHILSYIWTLSW